MAQIAVELREYLDRNPRILAVYFNSAGDWVFSPSNRHLERKTREQVLKMDVDTEERITPEMKEVEDQSLVKKAHKK